MQALRTGQRDHITGFVLPSGEKNMIRKSQVKTYGVYSGAVDEEPLCHPFIEERYWHGKRSNCTRRLLPAAQTHGYGRKNGQLKGFVSVLEARFVGALFVAPTR